MEFWTLDNLRSVCGGRWLARPMGTPAPAIVGVGTDTRQVRPGECFVALVGERHDAHAFVGEAASRGAVMAIVHDESRVDRAGLPGHFSLLLVEDTGQALLRLAGAYRRTLDATRVIAVGGSNGKTTTTRLIGSLLEHRFRGRVSAKSFNNAVGVPLTILSARRTDQYLVCEVGTNAPGEIASLAGVVCPEVAVITSIGREHLEGLVSLEGVVQEEAALLSTLRPNGLAVVTADAPPSVTRTLAELSREAAAEGRTLLRFGLARDADLRITRWERSGRGMRFCLNDRHWFTTPLVGRHNACNAVAAIAVARRMGLDYPEIVDALEVARGAEMRLEPVSAGGIEFLNDAYNANPDSVLAALAAFDEWFPAGVGGRRVVVLADMLELGAQASGAHAEMGEHLARIEGIDLSVLVGPHSRRAFEALGPGAGAVHFPEASEPAMSAIAGLLRPGDRVLLKGSRRNALERIVRLAGAGRDAAGASGAAIGRA